MIFNIFQKTKYLLSWAIIYPMPSNPCLIPVSNINSTTYTVTRLNGPIQLDARWEKNPWNRIAILRLNNYMGDEPEHFPDVAVRLAYDDISLYVIFRVADRYVCSRKAHYQDRVCEDSCVEFFFTPGKNRSNGYFNLEVNCGGTAYFHHQKGRGIADVPVSSADFNRVQIAHTAPKVIDEEITESTIWMVEYCLPYEILSNYASFTKPTPGVIWYANFYKCADESSHPHWLTWSKVDLPMPDFHQPKFFGRLEFG
jgi:hypothetical protein